MARRSARPFRPSFESLETRETPAVLFTDSFEQPTPPAIPVGWQTWSNTGTDSFLTTKLAAVSGAISIASTGSTTTQSRFWNTSVQPADAGVSVRVKSDGPAPAQVIARGVDLQTASPSYLAASVQPGGRQIDLIEVKNGTARTITTLRTANPAYGLWFTLTLQPAGNTATVRLQRPDTGQYLNDMGFWQTAPVDALKGTVTHTPSNGVAGFGRGVGNAGYEFYDDFTVTSPATTEIRETFDTTANGSRPSGWVNWTNDGTAGFTVTNKLAFSTPNGFANTGTSVTAARSWIESSQPADVQASVSIFTDGLIPTALAIRGSNLDSATPTYYGVQVVRGIEVRLFEVVNGTETTIATLKSKSYVSQTWIRVTLSAVGDRLNVVVNRPATGEWLTSDGDWQTGPQPAISITDSTIRTDGLVGVIRSAKTAGTVTLDDFEVRPASTNAGPSVTISASQPGTVFSNDVTFKVTANAGSDPRRIEFRLNGTLKSTAPAAPASWTLDTTQLPNGPQELAVWAYDAAGNASTTTFAFSTANSSPTPPPTRPDIPKHYTHIRIAQLAYTGNPMGTFEQARLKDSVDLVIPNASYLGTIDSVAPTTPQLVYSNLSNLYEGLLSSWLAYADTTGANRESAFYHVTKATPFTGSSASAVPVNYLWGVSRSAVDGSLTDLTAAARARTFGVAAGGVGTSLNFGHLDEFRELNVVLNKAATSGWQGTWEYVAAVDAAGNPTLWKPLRLVNDGTAGFTTNGRITFDPPADWLSAKLSSSSERLCTVRLRTTAGTSVLAPEAKTVLGRDHVNANGGTSGVIPAFDYAADKDADGYLNDAEYAGRATGFDARFVSETRLIYPYYGQMRFVTNPSSSALRKWAADYHTKMLAGLPLADGLFLDNSSGRLPFAGTPVLESTLTYSADFANMVSGVWKAVAPKMVFANTTGGITDADGVAKAATGSVEEFLLRPTDANWAGVNDLATLVSRRLAVDSPAPYLVLDSHPGSFSTADERVRTGTLAYYYLLADPDKTMLMLFGGYSPAAAWSRTWIPAISTNVGQPLGGMTTFATGTDPQNANLTYKVFRRDYSNALVLYKPRSYNTGKGTGTLDDTTATTHNLGGNYRVLASNGTLGPVINSITLRNGEGAVLMKV